MPFAKFLLPLIIMHVIATDVFAYSPKEGNVSGTLGFFGHRTNFIGSHTGASAPYKGDLAIFLNGDLNDRGGLEIGVFHLTKQYYRDLDSRYVGEETATMHITMGYRYWVLPSLSTALSFSSTYSMGEVRVLHDDFAPAPRIDTSASDTTEYGFDFSVQGEIYNRGRYTLIVDAIYSLSVTGKPNERADHYGVLLGIKYFIQEKQVVAKPDDAI